MRIFISCFETSGDNIAAQIIPCLRAQFGDDCHFFGITGEALAAQGVESWHDISTLGIMGLGEVLTKAPRLLRLVKSVAQRLDADPPDIVLCVDAPDFHVRLMEKMHNGVSVRAQMVSPSVWLWRSKRAKRFAAVFDTMYCIFPFEPQYYQGLPIHAQYVGHPSRDMVDRETITHQQFINHYGDHPTICFMPGSRLSELRALKKDFQHIARQLSDFRIVVPTFERLLPELNNWSNDSSLLFITEADWRYAAMRYSQATLCCLGTAETELSLRLIPHAAIYRFTGIDNLLRRLFTFHIQHFAMSNILLNNRAINEYVHNDIDHDQIAKTLRKLATDSKLRQDQRKHMQQVYDLLSPPDGYSHYGETIAHDLSRRVGA